MDTDPIAELTRLILSLPGLPPADRAVRARRLVDQAKTVLSQVGDEAVADLAEGTSYREAAEALCVSESAINKAITRHRARKES